VEQREVVDFISGETMNRRLLPLLLVFAFTGALPGQVPSKARIDSLLQAASNALDHYQTLAPSIRRIMPMRKRSVIPATACGKCSEEMFRTRRRTSHAIVRSPQKIMEGISDLGYVGDLYGETNRALFAEAYNSFVKITLWFGGEVRNTLQCSADKNCGCQHT
jgi:hypothetical protein